MAGKTGQRHHYHHQCREEKLCVEAVVGDVMRCFEDPDVGEHLFRNRGLAFFFFAFCVVDSDPACFVPPWPNRREHAQTGTKELTPKGGN